MYNILYPVYPQIATFDYGMKDQNPIDHMRFYTKDNLQTAIPVRKDQVSL